MATPPFALLGPGNRQILCADALVPPQHAPAQQPRTKITVWSLLDDTTPIPDGAPSDGAPSDGAPSDGAFPAQPHKLHHIPGEIQHRQKVAETDGTQLVPLKLPSPILPLLPIPSNVSISTRRSRSHSPSPSPSKPSSMFKREHLQHLDPSITVIGSRWKAQEQHGVQMPAAVAGLWELCENITVFSQNALIPADVGLPVNRIEETLYMVMWQAEACRECAAPASQWIAKVILPVLNSLETLPFGVPSSPTANDKIGVFDMRAVEMSPDCEPENTLPAAHFKDLDRKIDLVVGLHLHHATKSALCRAQAKAYECSKPINQASTLVHQNPLFLSIAVKRTCGGADPMVPLATWVAGEFIKRDFDGVDTGMPALAVEIDGDTWRLYVVVATVERGANGTKGTLRLNVIGHVTLGGTDTWLNLCRLYHSLCWIVEWGRTVYLPWFEREVLGI
ncbi:hypothetical protein K505DRAFT_341340 [Melanomma pulvis-pyrius CBS 109.77]|uniref:PD-(D/E)XK nuclease-like domain-containing protein n=1 Tax=Melanomma pulvis-pyrius CBS 109.77 TaxID=1314802 RepID=A0A6A6WZJ2_9PLEO|nr:hypothetical protein K505DRAFT_341340 [Melanomma pulvis-pyrius CBS 109.77]